MPIYEYRCDSCGFKKDHLQKMSDAPLTVCPNCAHESYVKQVSAAGFQLKGTGWYATDFKGSGSSAAKEKTGENTTGDSAAKTVKPTETASRPAGGCGGACGCHSG